MTTRSASSLMYLHTSRHTDRCERSRIIFGTILSMSRARENGTSPSCSNPTAKIFCDSSTNRA